jgi:hypothetical protein
VLESELACAGNEELHELGMVRLAQGMEGVLVFVGEDARELGATAVLERICGRAGVALGSRGAARSGSTAPGGFEFLLSESD